MTDPFRALDRIDPPDQWDDIVDRAGHDGVVQAVDDAPHRPTLARPRTWIAAAAVLALVGGGIVLATGDDDPQGVEIDPAESNALTTHDPVADGCTYSYEPGGLFPELQPGRHEVEPELGILAGATAPTYAHGTVDGLAVEVGVGTGMTTAALPDPGSFRTGEEGAGGFVEVAGAKDSGVEPPCDQVVVVVRKPLTAQELSAIDAGGPLPPRLTETLAVVLAGTNAIPDPGPAVPAEHFEGGCPFTVAAGSRPDLVAGRHPVEPELGILPGPIAPTFAHGSEDGVLIEIAVGTGLDGAVAPEGASLRSAIDGDSGWVEVGYVDSTRPDGPCDETMVVVRVPMLPEDLAAGGTDLDVETYTELAQVGSIIQAAITLDAGASGSSAGDDGSSPPRIEGTLDDGAPFEVWEDPGHGLCASLGDVDLGCDDEGPVISPDADPSTPRLGIDECCTPLWFGYLPEGAVDVVLDSATGERLDVESVLGDGIWAVPVPAEHARDDGFDSDTRVVFLTGDGTEVPAPHVG